MNKKFITRIPFFGNLFQNKFINDIFVNNSEYLYTEPLVHSTVSKKYGNACAECLKAAGLQDTCLESFDYNCLNKALSYCSHCINVCTNLCNPNSGGGYYPIGNMYPVQPEIVEYGDSPASVGSYPYTGNTFEVTPLGPVNPGTNIINSNSIVFTNENDTCGEFTPAPFSQKCLDCMRANNLITNKNTIFENCYNLFFEEELSDFKIYFIWANEDWSNNLFFNSLIIYFLYNFSGSKIMKLVFIKVICHDLSS